MRNRPWPNLRARPGIGPLRVGLLGHDGGTNVAVLAGARAPAPAFLMALGATGANGQELLARQTSLVNQPGEPDTAQITWATQVARVMTAARREAKKQLAAGANPAQTQLRIAQEQLRLTTEARKHNDALHKRQYALLEIIRQTADNAQAQAIVANMLKQIYPALTPAAAQVRAGQLTSPWYRSFLTFNTQAELAKVACPTLLLHGTADTGALSGQPTSVEKRPQSQQARTCAEAGRPKPRVSGSPRRAGPGRRHRRAPRSRYRRARNRGRMGNAAGEITGC